MARIQSVRLENIVGGSFFRLPGKKAVYLKLDEPLGYDPRKYGLHDEAQLYMAIDKYGRLVFPLSEETKTKSVIPLPPSRSAWPKLP